MMQWYKLSIPLYVYLFTNDHAHGITGIGRVSTAVMCVEMKITRKELERCKQEIGDKVVWFDDGTYWVVGRAKRTCFKRDGSPNPKHAQGAKLFVEALCPEARELFTQKYPSVMGYRYPIEGVSKGHPTLPTDTDTDTEDEVENEADTDGSSSPQNVDNSTDGKSTVGSVGFVPFRELSVKDKKARLAAAFKGFETRFHDEKFDVWILATALEVIYADSGTEPSEQEREEITASLEQARGKINRAAYFISVLVDRKYPASDAAREKAKRKLGIRGRDGR